ncbi:hypothetical protein [Altericroceibacterium spongiae]|uniref:hypothetical protein n=1 Tax=Altericroceibacterium spongiae TaxID=2320269 RepID=UPI0011C48806|nr:hypothetical protein [Altericroceibacterium spongiae]
MPNTPFSARKGVGIMESIKKTKLIRDESRPLCQNGILNERMSTKGLQNSVAFIFTKNPGSC